MALKLVTQERDTGTRENENLIRDLMDLQNQLTRKEAHNHELIKNEKKLKEQLKYENARFQKINASYNTIKGTLIALLQTQEPTSMVASTSDSATMNTITALQEELQIEKLQRQLLVSGFMSQTAQHEAKVKELEQELAQAKAKLELQKQQRTNAGTLELDIEAFVPFISSPPNFGSCELATVKLSIRVLYQRYSSTCRLFRLSCGDNFCHV
ncbi:hypothetical protein L7F22_041704 [Adiantum nelumboides]|nr:hypothetical protein [Adiantum nelumboides]